MGGRLECLDGLRGVLALYVLVSHMAAFTVLPGWMTLAFTHGEAAVDLFFVLSGMVIVRSLDSFAYDRKRFLMARAARTMPAFLVVFVVAVAVQPLPTPLAWMPWVAAHDPGRAVWSSDWPIHWVTEIGAHLTMTHGLIPIGALPYAWISFLGASWSLSTEWQFYALIAMLAAVPRRRIETPARGLVWLAWLFLAVSALGLLWSWSGPEAWRFSKAFLPNKAQYFALGVASAGLGLEASPRAIVRFSLALAAMAALCVAQGGVDKLAAPSIWVLCLATQYRASTGGAGGGRMLGWLGRTLRAPALLTAGAASYCIYLVNEPVQKLLGLALARLAGGDGALFTVLWVPSAILLPLALVWVLHTRIEQPALRASRIVLARRTLVVT